MKRSKTARNLLCGGKRDGAMLDATVLTNTNPEMRVVSEEIFAPVAVVEKFTDFEEAVDLSNHTKYGLQAGVFTQNLTNANYAAENLEFGGVIINDVPTFRVDNMPYGGVKDSGFGREGVIPYIEAENDADLYFVQGFVTASDRLWQMDHTAAWQADGRRNFSETSPSNAINAGADSVFRRLPKKLTEIFRLNTKAF